MGKTLIFDTYLSMVCAREARAGKYLKVRTWGFLPVFIVHTVSAHIVIKEKKLGMFFLFLKFVKSAFLHYLVFMTKLNDTSLEANHS